VALAHAQRAAAQAVRTSTGAAPALVAWSKEMNLHHVILADFRRQVVAKYDALVTDDKSPIFQHAKRAYFVIDKNGVVKFVKVMDNPLDLLEPADLLAAVK